MRIALVAPPFISIPPKLYGGTELFIGQLARGLSQFGLDVVVYTNGESTVEVERRWLYDTPQWPISGEIFDNLKDLNHTSWSVRDASDTCDIIHLNNAPGLAFSRYIKKPFVYTIHHPHLEGLSEFYGWFPDVHYVTISDFQRYKEKLPHIRTVHHGIDLSLYRLQPQKQQYLSFIGRIAPMKGAHLAVEVARRSGVPLKIAGEIQPMFREYYEMEVAPHVDGKLIEYVGEMDLEGKNELLGNSLAMLFPIQWDEPFGLVMIEAMATGTPVLALPGGSVTEVVRDGVSGAVCQSVDEMVDRVRSIEGAFPPEQVRGYVEEFFSVERMVSDYAHLYDEILSAPQEAEVPVERAVA
jgi:glycosyltransferase involved in cell wall biosynthesis